MLKERYNSLVERRKKKGRIIYTRIHFRSLRFSTHLARTKKKEKERGNFDGKYIFKRSTFLVPQSISIVIKRNRTIARNDSKYKENKYQLMRAYSNESKSWCIRKTVHAARYYYFATVHGEKISVYARARKTAENRMLIRYKFIVGAYVFCPINVRARIYNIYNTRICWIVNNAIYTTNRYVCSIWRISLLRT